jgi:hypothetical protein
MIDISDGAEIHRIFKLTNSRVNVSCQAGQGRVNHFHHAILSTISSSGAQVQATIGKQEFMLFFEWQDIILIESYRNV